jgi:ABC-type transporter MlaC component
MASWRWRPSLRGWHTLRRWLPRGRPAPDAALRAAAARLAALEPALRGDPRVPIPSAAVRTALRALSAEIFDLDAMARGVLWQHWAEAPAGDRSAFLRLFTELLGRLAVAHALALRRVTVWPIRESAQGEHAVVVWRVSTLTAGALVEFRLRWRDGRWKVRDALVNGESFVSSCREDFHEVLRSAAWPGLLRVLGQRTHAGFVGVGLTLGPAVERPAREA